MFVILLSIVSCFAVAAELKNTPPMVEFLWFFGSVTTTAIISALLFAVAHFLEYANSIADDTKKIREHFEKDGD